MSHEADKPLSSQGRARREAMLGDLQRRVRRHARARSIRSGVIACAALGALASLSVFLTPRAAPELAEMKGPPITPDAAPSTPRVQIVRTDPDVLARVTLPPSTGVLVRLTVHDAGAPSIERIDDDELIHVFAEMGRPTGLVRSEGRVWLTAEVAFGQPMPAGEDSAGSG